MHPQKIKNCGIGSRLLAVPHRQKQHQPHHSRCFQAMQIIASCNKVLSQVLKKLAFGSSTPYHVVHP